MQVYLYLSLIPEALIASMLPPHEFGSYLAVGTRKRTRGEAIFLQVDRSFKSKYFRLQDIEERCLPHENGDPKHSVYISIYRVLENVPLDALQNLYLTTDDGRVLELEQQSFELESEGDLHLYQEVAPVNPLIASNLSPYKFCEFITNEDNPIFVPKIAFFDLSLKGLADDPENAPSEDLPYPNMDHLRACLKSLQEKPEKNTKTVIRYMHQDILYRTIQNGFFIGDNKKCLFYPFPSEQEMESKHHEWWRSATIVGF